MGDRFAPLFCRGPRALRRLGDGNCFLPTRTDFQNPGLFRGEAGRRQVLGCCLGRVGFRAGRRGDWSQGRGWGLRSRRRRDGCQRLRSGRRAPGKTQDATQSKSGQKGNEENTHLGTLTRPEPNPDQSLTNA
jgi:hypothetical protein